MEEVKVGLPTDIKVSVTFRQEDYIDASIENVRGFRSKAASSLWF